MIVEKLQSFGGPAVGGLLALLTSSDLPDEATAESLEDIAATQRWLSINATIAERLMAVAGAEAFNHTLAAELESLDREIALIGARIGSP